MDGILDLFVCVDCGLMLANGDVDEPDPRWTGWSAGWDDYIVVNGDGERDEDFSWGRCDGCGSTLGGARMHCQAWKAEK